MNPAHFRVETFYPATILALNKLLQLNIPLPKFRYDVNLRQFIFNYDRFQS